MLTKLLIIILSAFIIWQMFVYFRTHPEAFSKDNLSRSVFALGVLALLLIGFVALLVFIVKQQ
jgi:hypothetical protein